MHPPQVVTPSFDTPMNGVTTLRHRAWTAMAGSLRSSDTGPAPLSQPAPSEFGLIRVGAAGPYRTETALSGRRHTGQPPKARARRQTSHTAKMRRSMEIPAGRERRNKVDAEGRR